MLVLVGAENDDIIHETERADPEKTSAIQVMRHPNSISDLRRFMGMVNQMGKHSPHIAEVSQPLRELLSTKR